MRITVASDGKKAIRLSRAEWLTIGKQAGWDFERSERSIADMERREQLISPSWYRTTPHQPCRCCTEQDVKPAQKKFKDSYSGGGWVLWECPQCKSQWSVYTEG